MKKSCKSCMWGFEGTCNECAGENYGHTTEISDNGFCTNYRYENWFMRWRRKRYEARLARVKKLGCITIEAHRYAGVSELQGMVSDKYWKRCGNCNNIYRDGWVCPSCNSTHFMFIN